MKMLINGQFVDASNGATINVVNPVTGKVLDTVPSATKQDVEKAVTYAVESQPAWNRMPTRLRCEILRKFAALVKERKYELAASLTAETGKPYTMEALAEIESAAFIFESACEIAPHHYGNTLQRGTEPGYDDDFQFTVNEPLGVIACIIPFNFPIALWAFKAGAALAAGNAIVVKAPSKDPLTLIKVTELLYEAGVPAGVVDCLTGSGGDVGRWLVDDNRVCAVNFTGSTETGIDIAKVAAEHLTPYTFELGGNDPFILCADGDLELALKEAADKARNAGQCCSAAKRFIIHNSLKDEFVRRLKEEYLDQLVMGDPMDEKTTMGPVITERDAIGVIDKINKTLAQGATLYCGGKRNGAFVEPTILTDVTAEMDIARDMEVFGPVWPVLGFDTVEEAIELANLTNYGLSSGVFTKDMITATRFVREIKAGYVTVNGSGGFRAAELPFGGGKKRTGNARESMMTLMDEVTQKESVILRYFLKDM